MVDREILVYHGFMGLSMGSSVPEVNYNNGKDEFRQAYVELKSVFIFFWMSRPVTCH